MTPRKLTILICVYPYNGNSTGTSLSWPTCLWLMQTMVRLKTEEKFTSRLDQVWVNAYADTPITMTRNASIEDARKLGADLMLMIDSDIEPDVHSTDPDFVPFLDAAFDRIYDKWEEGPRMVAAPYGGAPPFENQFIFRFRHTNNFGDESYFHLDQYTREEAAMMSGIHEAAALPTGLIMYDMRCFDLIEPPYFRYEWEDETESKKASTEDVKLTRDIAIAGCEQLGYCPCECAWSSWAGHHKNWCVKKPVIYTTANVAENLSKALGRPDAKVIRMENFVDPDILKRFQATDGRVSHANGEQGSSRLQGAERQGVLEG